VNSRETDYENVQWMTRF